MELGLLTFVSVNYAKLLQMNQLDTFEAVWNRKVDWFEEPNERRGGWSGVGRIELMNEDATVLGAYLKRQDNHCQTSWMHPVKGVPTFQREFEMMRYLQQHGVRVPEVMLFSRNPAGDFKTTLMTRELAGFEPLENLTERLFADNRPTLSVQKSIIKAVAKQASQLHAAKIQHRSFYPKHLFISMADAKSPEVAVIDLEKSRINLLPVLRSLIDLSTLNRHAKYWTHSRRMYFYLQYLGIERLTPFSKWLCRRIIKRSNRVKRK